MSDGAGSPRPTDTVQGFVVRENAAAVPGQATKPRIPNEKAKWRHETFTGEMIAWSLCDF